MPALSVETLQGGAHRLASEGTNGQAAIAAVSHQTREDVMKNLFQTEYRIAAVYSLAALYVGGRIFHQRQTAIWVAAQPHYAFPKKRLGVRGRECVCDLYDQADGKRS